MTNLDQINELVLERNELVTLANKIEKFRKYKGYTQKSFLSFLLNQDHTLRVSMRVMHNITAPNREITINGRKVLPTLNGQVLTRIAEIINQHELANAHLEGKTRPTFKKIEHDVTDEHSIRISLREYNDYKKSISKLRLDLMEARNHAVNFAFYTIEETQNATLKKTAKQFLHQFMILDKGDYNE